MSNIFPQTSVAQFPGAAFQGQLYDGLTQNDTESASVSETGGVDAGLAVILDGGPTLKPGYSLKVKYPVNASSVVEGFTVYQPLREPANPRFALYDTVALLKKGRIWVLVQSTVVQGDDVYAWYSTGSTKGSIRPDAGSTQAVKVRGAKVLIGGATAGLALIDVNLPLASADNAYQAGATFNVTAVKTSTYTAVVGDFVRTDASGGAFTVNLPTAVGIAGRQIKIAESANSTTAVTLDGAGSETINGAATQALTTAYGEKTLTSDGANWLMGG